MREKQGPHDSRISQLRAKIVAKRVASQIKGQRDTEALTGASRASIQRNLAWMEARSLIREMTGQGRYRMWRVSN